MVLILCNAPLEQGASIARTLVEESLAACVSRASTFSTYRWDGKIHEDEEETLTIKTAEATLKACTRRLKELHPYDVPEILVVPSMSRVLLPIMWSGSAINAHCNRLLLQRQGKTESPAKHPILIENPFIQKFGVYSNQFVISESKLHSEMLCQASRAFLLRDLFDHGSTTDSLLHPVPK